MNTLSLGGRMTNGTEPVTVLRNVRVYTMDARQPEAAALAWRGERLIAVGAADEVAAAAGPGARLIDGAGRTVVPGLIDSHIHFMGYADSLLRVDLDGVPSLETALERVAARTATASAGAWVRGRGWNNNLWSPTTFPTRHDLDRVTGDHPALMARKDGHSIWVNSAALALAGITRDTADPPGGRIGRDAQGEPDGILYESAAMDSVYRLLSDESAAERRAAVQLALRDVKAGWVTG